MKTRTVRTTHADSDHDGFRGDLEGLRAVAVVLVLLYHAQIPGFGGGYVGVDVFFVLSGFLITGILLRELSATGSISLPNFYARRLRRILPASVLIVVVTLAASVVALSPLQLVDVTRDAAAAVLYVPNIRYALEATDYLQSQAAASPLLHYWSLGVEEQFYLFWPALVLLAGRGLTLRHHGSGTAGGPESGDATDQDSGSRLAARRRLRIGLLALAISSVSLVAAIWLTDVNAPWAFFSLPTRAWELGIGALIAVAGTRLASLPAHVASAAGWLGLIVVAVSGMLLNDSVPFPGTAALAPTLGTALVIVAGFRPGFGPARLLDTAAPRYLGRISYSLYLWHWPLLILPAEAAGAPLSLPARVALLAVSVILAAATQLVVENPLRRGRFIGTRARRNLAMAGALSLAVATVATGAGLLVDRSLQSVGNSSLAADTANVQRIIAGAALPSSGSATGGSSPTATGRPAGTAGPSGFPPTPDSPVPYELRPSLPDVRASVPPPYTDGCHLPLTEVAYKSACLFGDPNGSRSVVLFGDSHAVMWWPAVEDVAVNSGWRFYNYTKSGCSAADVLQWEPTLKRMFTECTAWRASMLAKIGSMHPDLVIVASLANRPLVDDQGRQLGVAAAQAAWRSGLTRTLVALSSEAGHVVMMNDAPVSRVDVPACLSEHRTSILACATPLSFAIETSWDRTTVSAAQAAGVAVVDPTRWVCPSAPCPPVVGDFVVYRDDRHITPPFAEALSPELAAAIPLFDASPTETASPRASAAPSTTSSGAP